MTRDGMARATGEAVEGRPVLFRGGTVLTMDHEGVLEQGDVLVVGDRIAQVGAGVPPPEDALVVDCSGGIVMPGMIDTHRHMWQTAMRGFGADWTLSQYFAFFYLQWGKAFRPEDIYTGNLLSAIEAVDAGVTTTVDWSHGLRTVEHAEAAVDALREVPGRFVLAYGNNYLAPEEWTARRDFREFVSRHFSSPTDMLGFQLAFNVTGDPEFPERAAFEAARELGVAVTSHVGVWKVTDDRGVRLMSDHGYLTEQTTCVHAATLSEDSYRRIAASGAHASVSTESEQNAGQGYPTTWQLRRHGIPISLSTDTSVWWSADMFSAMRATLDADRCREHLEAHALGETCVSSGVRAAEVVRWATVGGAETIGLGDVVGSLAPGKKADVVVVKNDRSPVLFPILNPFGHVVFQAGRGDVHTVMVNGRIVKLDHDLVGVDLSKARRAAEETVAHLRRELGTKAWAEAMHPELPDAGAVADPYLAARRQGAP